MYVTTSILVSKNQHNKTPQTVAYTTDIYFFIILEAGKSKINILEGISFC